MKKQEIAVYLTNEEWSALTFYIRISKTYRDGEQEVWERISEEKNKDGTPKFEYAASNADFWKRMEQTLTEIRKKIDARSLA